MQRSRITRRRGRQRQRRRRFVVSIVCALSAASLLVSPAGARGPPAGNAYVLDLDLQATPKIGGKHIGNLEQAAREFGRPQIAAITILANAACRASWPRRGLAIDFVRSDGEDCSFARVGRWLDVVASGLRWQTVRGLRVGDGEARLRALYPSARSLDFLGRGRLVELETGGPYCDGGAPLALAARVRLGRVVALLVVHVQACG